MENKRRENETTIVLYDEEMIMTIKLTSKKTRTEEYTMRRRVVMKTKTGKREDGREDEKIEYEKKKET